MLSSTIGLNYKSAQGNILQENPKFVCAETFNPEEDRSVPTTIVVTDKEKHSIIQWTAKYFTQKDPLTRCQIETPHFQEAFDKGKLGIITNGTMNHKSVICVPESVGGDCEHLLMEVFPEENSIQILNYLKSVFDGEIIVPIQHSSSTPQIFYKIDINNVDR